MAMWRWLHLGAPGEMDAVRVQSIVLITFGGIVLLIVLALALVAIDNRRLPAHSEVADRLTETNKARLAEYWQLHAQIANQVWPGWGDAPIPVIVHNEAYAFLVGYPGAPPDGWEMAPRGERRGGPWEKIPGERLMEAPVYRQRLAGTTGGAFAATHVTPENFTVRVGDVWVATLFTKEYAAVSFYRGFRQEMPSFLQPIIPYRLIWSFLGGATENYIGGLAHEAFHAHQARFAYDQFAAAEGLHSRSAAYPFDTAPEAWKAELSALHGAATAAADPKTPEAEVTQLAREALALRQARREAQGLSPALVDYERQREWLEGLAKYAELAIGLEAQRAVEAGAYTPVAGIDKDPAFKGYRTRERFWSAQLGEVQRMANRSGETRFYYTGFAQGVILDRLAPDWHTDAFDNGVWLETLVSRAAAPAP